MPIFGIYLSTVKDHSLIWAQEVGAPIRSTRFRLFANISKRTGKMIGAILPGDPGESTFKSSQQSILRAAAEKPRPPRISLSTSHLRDIAYSRLISIRRQVFQLSMVISPSSMFRRTRHCMALCATTLAECLCAM